MRRNCFEYIVGNFFSFSADLVSPSCYSQPLEMLISFLLWSLSIEPVRGDVTEFDLVQMKDQNSCNHTSFTGSLTAPLPPPPLPPKQGLFLSGD